MIFSLSPVCSLGYTLNISYFGSDIPNIFELVFDSCSVKLIIKDFKTRLNSFKNETFEGLTSSQKFWVEYFRDVLLGFITCDDCQRTNFSFPTSARSRRASPLPNPKYLSDESPKDKPWDSHRANSDKVACHYHSEGYDRYSERISHCSTRLEFVQVVDGELKSYKLRSALFCRHRYCTVCQWRNSLMWTARLLKAMPKIQKDYPTHRYILLTLTVKNCPIEELRSTVEWMHKSWERFVKRKSFPGVGFIRSLEVTRNKKDNTAHPHFHVLMMVPSGYFGKSGGYLSKDKWIEMWKSCLRVNYDPSIDVKVVNEKTNKNGLVGALKEVLKYTVKPSDLVDDAPWLIELTEQMFKVRTRSTGGVFKKYITDEDPKDYITEDPEADDKPVSDERYLFDWNGYAKRYVKKEMPE